MREFKLRASKAGAVMTNPKEKKDLISKTTLSYVEEWLKSELYGHERDVKSKYIDKGNEKEDEAIDKAIEWLDLGFILKNEESFEDEFFTGTPDIILENEVLDIKCSWDCFTFPLFEDEIPTIGYYYQLQVYMHLTGKKKARLVYVLLNDPHNYDLIDKKYKIKTFDIDYDPAVIEDLKQRITNIREYLKTNEKYKL